MDTRNVGISLEEVLRARYEEIKHNIHYDTLRAALYAARTGLTDATEKRRHASMKERTQVEWYKADELRLIAHRAGIEL
jgi:hypothetical protein